MRSLAAEARAARHFAILDEATIEFNRDGVAGARLSSIARRVGLTRASLYNYCADRQDLAFQCYQRTCALTQDDLMRAHGAPGSGAERLEAFLKLAGDTDHSPTAILSEIAFLNEEQQALVRASRAENVKVLKRLLLEGQQDGSLRKCDPDVVCQTILGLLAWAPIAQMWSEKIKTEFATRTAAMIPDMLINGLVPQDVPLPTDGPRSAGLRGSVQRSQHEQRLEELARVGSRLFNRRGIAGVSLEEIAEEGGATRGALYRYFTSRSEFVAFCYERALDILEPNMTVAESCRTGLESLMMAIELGVEAQLAEIYPLWWTTGLGGLPPKIRARLLTRFEAVAARATQLMRRGVADGSLRPVDLEALRLSMPGCFTYLSIWLPDADERRAAEIAQEVSHVLLLGLRKRP